MDDIVCSVVYDDNEIAGLTAGKVATLTCGGKSMKSDITIFTYASSGGAALNLAFGDTAPEDTGKLWVKTAEPLSVAVKLNADVTGNDGLLSGIAAIPTAAYGIGTAAVGTKVYLFGGRIGTTSTNSNSYNSSIRVFDTETGTVETLSTTLPTLTEGMGTATVGTKVYLFGGCYSSTYYSSIHQFTALIDLPENHLMIEASAFENRFNLLPNLEMGVKNVFLGNAEGKGERVTAALYQDGAWVEI